MKKFAIVALVAVVASVAWAKDKPQAPHIAIQAGVDKIHAAALAEFVPHNYSIDSDTPAQLRISRPMTTVEVLSWQSDHMILGPSTECRRVHSLIFIPSADAIDVTMQWETVCPQPRGGEFRAANDKKKELEWMQSELATLKSKIEASK